MTPRSPLGVRDRRNLLQKVSVADGWTAMPALPGHGRCGRRQRLIRALVQQGPELLRAFYAYATSTGLKSPSDAPIRAAPSNPGAMAFTASKGAMMVRVIVLMPVNDSANITRAHSSGRMPLLNNRHMVIAGPCLQVISAQDMLLPIALKALDQLGLGKARFCERVFMCRPVFSPMRGHVGADALSCFLRQW